MKPIPGFTEEEIRYYVSRYERDFIDYEKLKEKRGDPNQTKLGR